MIFYTISKPQLNEQGEKEKDRLTTSQALQIAGRAGRFSSAFQDGEVTTFKKEDLPLLKDILNRQVETIKVSSVRILSMKKQRLSPLMDLHSVLVFIQQQNRLKCLPIIYQNILFRV